MGMKTLRNAVGVINNQEGKILLIRNNSGWKLPHGIVGIHQIPVEGLYTKLNDILGIEFTLDDVTPIIDFSKDYHIGKDDITANTFIFNISNYRGDITEDIEYQWVTITELKKMKDICRSTREFLKTI